jgi:superfamily II DNA or RNA helicase
MKCGEWFEDDEIDYELNDEHQSRTIELREWQREAKKFFFENDGKCLFEVVTGGGKTFIAINILEDIFNEHPDYKALVVVPKNVILETGWYKEFVDYGFPIQDIGVYYGNVKEYSKVTLTNMQSIDKIPVEMFDVLLADEIHNYATKKMMKYINHPFKYKLGLTATLKRLDNKHIELMKSFDYNIYKYTPDEALFDKVLNPFEFFNIGVKLDAETMREYLELTQQLNTVFKKGGSYESVMRTGGPLKLKMLTLMNKRKVMINNYSEKFEIATELILKHKDNKVIVFNQFNDQTSRLYWYLLDYSVDCRVLHSGVRKEQREQNLIDFRNDKYSVLLTSKVLDEGYNLPKLDVAIIMAGDTSDRQTVQRMGRVLRKKKGVTSKLYQIYCKDTVEERSASKRSVMFKSLSSNYKDVVFSTKNDLDF